MNPINKPEYHLKIIASPQGVHGPLWSVIIPTYNCAVYLKYTLQSILLQDPGPEQMEIIVVDDHSTKDDPEEVVKQYGADRIQFIRQDKNVGKSRNYATGINQSRGRYIHLLHGDDTVSKGFYREMASLFTSYPKASVAFCRCDYINASHQKIGETSLLGHEAGLLDNFLEQIAVWQLIQPPSIVFKREVYETLGSYDVRLKYMEDWEFYVRAATQFQFAYTPKALSQYRIFPGNSSSQSAKGGKRVATIKQVFSIMDEYVPSYINEKIRRTRNHAAAVYLLNFIPRLVADRDLRGFVITTKAFANYNNNLRLWGRWLRFMVHK